MEISSKNEELLEAMKMLKKIILLHLMGLLSDGGVHSHIDSFISIIKIG